MPASTEAPRRWHLYWVNLGPRLGTRPGKRRPCLVIQSSEIQLTSTVVLPVTSRVLPTQAFPIRVRLPAGTCGLPHDSDVMVDQLLASENVRFREDLGEVPEAIRDEVRQALLEFLDLG